MIPKTLILLPAPHILALVNSETAFFESLPANALASSVRIYIVICFA